MSTCRYCNEIYNDTHTCWTVYCLQNLKRNCETCTNKCKGYYAAQTVAHNEPSSEKMEGRLEVVESAAPAEKKEGRLEVVEAVDDGKNPR